MFQIECFETTLCKRWVSCPFRYKDTNVFRMCSCGVCVCRWAHQRGGSKLLILLVSCAMNCTGTLRPAAAQVRHPVAVHRYNIWGGNCNEILSVDMVEICVPWEKCTFFSHKVKLSVWTFLHITLTELGLLGSLIRMASVFYSKTCGSNCPSSLIGASSRLIAIQW